MRLTAGRLLTGVDLAATFVFAVEGAITAGAFGLNWFGVLVVSFSTALVGGIVRDLLIGYTPPASLRGAVYPLTAFAGAAIVLILDRAMETIPAVLLLVSDAAGLALFAVVGTTKALDFRLNWLAAIMLGTISAVGGGVIRDVLLNIVPAVLRTDIYAAAALVGAGATVLARWAGASRAVAMAVGFVACFGLRLVGVELGWTLPTFSL